MLPAARGSEGAGLRVAALGERLLEPLDLAVEFTRATGADVRLEYERDARPEGQDGLGSRLHDGEDLVPLPFDLGEHRRRAVRQARGADDGDRCRNSVVHRGIRVLGGGSTARGRAWPSLTPPGMPLRLAVTRHATARSSRTSSS